MGQAGNSENQGDALMENHRFWLAIALVLTMAVIIAIPTLYQSYNNAQLLAGIFSGWIATAVGFYFMHESTTQAQQQAKALAGDASEARKESIQSNKKTTILAQQLEATLTEYQAAVNELEKLKQKIDQL